MRKTIIYAAVVAVVVGLSAVAFAAPPPGKGAINPRTTAYATGGGDVLFTAAAGPVDFMRLDLPAGNYIFNLDIDYSSQLLYDSSNNPYWGPAGAVECRFYEEYANGSRSDLSGVKTGLFGFGDEEGLEDMGVTTALGSHPANTDIVLVCEHNFGGPVQTYGANWTAVAVDVLELQYP